MSVELSRLDALRYGPPTASVLVGFLALEATRFLEAKMPHVYLGRDHYLKIRRKPEVDRFDLLHVTDMIFNGLIIAEEGNKLSDNR